MPHPLELAPCFLRQFDEHTAPLQRCSRCKARCYCSQACQRNDWREHKKECQSLANRASTTSIHDPSDDNTIYYLKASKPRDHDISISGPFHPLNMILEQFRARLDAEKSVSGRYYFEWLLEEVSITGISSVRAPLPVGSMMTIQIIPEQNPDVAAVMRSNPGEPKEIYKLGVTKPRMWMEEESIVRTHYQDYVPLEESDIFGTFTTKEAANRAAKELVEQWKREVPGHKVVSKISNTGLVYAAAMIPGSRIDIMCEVSRADTGRTFSNGTVRY